jgi:hypothetical protein
MEGFEGDDVAAGVVEDAVDPDGHAVAAHAG